MDSKKRAKLDAELTGIYPHLLAKAELIVRRSGWRRRFEMNRKSVAEDLLHEAVFRAISGPRQWNPDKVNLWGFLVGAMRSIVNAATRSLENKTDSLDEPLPNATGTRVDALESEAASAEDALGSSADVDEREAAIFAAAGDDPVLLKYVEALMDGFEKQADIAEHMGVAAEVVYQAHRKLRRRIEARKKKEGAP